jgi:HlyD family secretion protein
MLPGGGQASEGGVMSPKLIVPMVIVVALVLLLGFKIRAQEAALEGPSGGTGVIEGTDYNVSSRLSARVLQVNVKKGRPVKKGDLVMTLDCADPTAALAEVEARLEGARAQAEAASAQAQAAQRVRNAAQQSIQVAKAQAEALAAQRDTARRQAERLGSLGQDVPASNLDQAQGAAEGLKHQAQAALAGSNLNQQQAEASLEQSRAAQAQAQAALRAVVAAESIATRARLMVAECEVRSPSDGLVDEVFYEEGELPLPGAVLARVVNLNEVRATFYLPNSELASAKPSAQALVEADAYPGREFQGAIHTVSAQAEFTPRNIQTRTDRDRLVYAVEVKVPNSEQLLRPGMPVRVIIPGTRR